jgi:lysophospholipase L1-like esterase
MLKGRKYKVRSSKFKVQSSKFGLLSNIIPSFHHFTLGSWLLLLASITQAQIVVDTTPPRYSFIIIDSNFVYNDSLALGSFYEKLAKVQKTKECRLNIVHIGDSHIQADHFSGKLRQNFQCDFGNAGRGFIFPYRVAHSNEPVSYKTSTNVVWQAKRNPFPEQPLPIGIGGFTIETGDTAAEIKLLVKDQGGLDYSFNKITLFHAKSEDNFDFAIYDSLYNEIGYVNNTADSANKYTSTLTFDRSYRNIIVKSCPRNTSQTCAQIYGMLLENDKPGILYDMIGVNGAEYKHYNMSQYFIEQLPLLKPDLIIISMGTNEGYTASFNKDKFYASIDTLVSDIKRTNPGAAFLLTTPGDSFRRTRKGRVKNPDMLEARNTIIKYCEQHNFAYWDLYAVMGGYGSMLKWYKAKLTAKDRLHFSAAAYVLQGDLMYKAIITNYNKYMNKK